MMSDVDKAALTAKVRKDLATCQTRLLADLSQIIAKQHETLLHELLGQLNGSSLRESANRAEPAPPELSRVTPSQPPAMTQSRDQQMKLMERKDQEPKQLTSETIKLVEADRPAFSHQMSSVSNPSPSPHEDELSSEEDDDLKPKVDAGFGSIFAASALDGTDLEEPHYHVEDFYSKEGWAQRLARDDNFTNVTLGIIALNAVYIGVDADWNPAEALYNANGFFIFMDNAFAAFFSFELLVRFLAFAEKRNCLKDGWFKFDTFLVLIMVLETWIMAPAVALMTSGGGVAIPVQPLRLLRLLRLTRMTRLMRSLPELVTMTKGMKVASRAVFSSLLMVALLIYTFAIVLNMFLKENTEINAGLAPRNFETIPQTMWTLLMDGTFMDSTGDVLTSLLFSGEVGCWIACVVFMAFILFSAITVMNMLIGVLCEVVSAVAQAEKDEADIMLAKQSILMNLKKFENSEGKITRHALTHVFKDKQAKKVLKSLNIDQLFLTELQQLLFPSPDANVSIRAIMELMLMCRGDLPVTVQHIASAQAALFMSLDKVEHNVKKSLEEIMRNEMELLRETSYIASQALHLQHGYPAAAHEHIPEKLDQACLCAPVEDTAQCATISQEDARKTAEDPQKSAQNSLRSVGDAAKDTCEDFCTPSGSPRQIALF